MLQKYPRNKLLPFTKTVLNSDIKLQPNDQKGWMEGCLQGGPVYGLGARLAPDGGWWWQIGQFVNNPRPWENWADIEAGRRWGNSHQEMTSTWPAVLHNRLTLREINISVINNN